MNSVEKCWFKNLQKLKFGLSRPRVKIKSSKLNIKKLAFKHHMRKKNEEMHKNGKDFDLIKDNGYKKDNGLYTNKINKNEEVFISFKANNNQLLSPDLKYDLKHDENQISNKLQIKSFPTGSYSYDTQNFYKSDKFIILPDEITTLPNPKKLSKNMLYKVKEKPLKGRKKAKKRQTFHNLRENHLLKPLSRNSRTSDKILKYKSPDEMGFKKYPNNSNIDLNPNSRSFHYFEKKSDLFESSLNNMQVHDISKFKKKSNRGPEVIEKFENPLKSLKLIETNNKEFLSINGSHIQSMKDRKYKSSAYVLVPKFLLTNQGELEERVGKEVMYPKRNRSDDVRKKDKEKMSLYHTLNGE